MQIYNLHDDARYLSALQNASLNRVDAGLQNTHGLVGSDEWWQAIENGALPLHTIYGRITRIFGIDHYGFPEFELVNSEGSTSWACKGDIKNYSVGDTVKIHYVLQWHKVQIPNASPTSRTIIAIYEVSPGRYE